MNASGLASSRANIICSMVVFAGRSREAIPQAVSLALTGPYSPGMAVCVATCAGAATGLAGCATGWAAAAGGATALAGVTTGARRLVVVGGSNSTVYSRIRRPRGQFTSIRKFRNGSRIGKSDVTRTTGLLREFSIGSNLSNER